MIKSIVLKTELSDKSAQALEVELNRLESKFAGSLGRGFSSNPNRFMSYLFREAMKDEEAIKKAAAGYEAVLQRLASIQETTGILSDTEEPAPRRPGPRPGSGRGTAATPPTAA